MFSISNDIITVNRGDSFELPITLNVGSSICREKYDLHPQDVIYLGVMEPNQPFEVALIRKKFTYGDFVSKNKQVVFRFWPEDTVQVLPGKYYYQVKLQTVDEETGKFDVETIVNKSLFYILE